MGYVSLFADAMREASLTDEHPPPAPFWQRKRLDEMTPDEWERLCDGCGRCCLLKLEDEDTGDIYLSRVACRLLDLRSCRCSSYADRRDHVPDCIQLTPGLVSELSWLPESCAYRRIFEGRGLAWWHPLVSGDPATVAEAGVSVRDWAIRETRKRANQLHRYLIVEEG